jgi:hypothetical protein
MFTIQGDGGLTPLVDKSMVEETSKNDIAE